MHGRLAARPAARDEAYLRRIGRARLETARGRYADRAPNLEHLRSGRIGRGRVGCADLYEIPEPFHDDPVQRRPDRIAPDGPGAQRERDSETARRPRRTTR